MYTNKCKKCNCTLDPGEQCDCEPEVKILKRLFDKEKEYVFSLELFQETTLIPKEDLDTIWPYKLEGKKVILTNPFVGTCGEATVFPEWCKEVSNE